MQIQALLALALLNLASPGVPHDLRVQPEPEFDARFARKEGWTGGDIAASVPLGPGRILWLFGDSWIGRVAGGRHVGASLVSNTVAIQQGIDLRSAKLAFYLTRSKKGPTPFFKTRQPGALWLTHGGLRVDRTLYLVASRVVPTKTSADDPFGFRTTGMVLIQISNPDAEPARWRRTERDIPWVRLDSRGHGHAFGNPAVRKDGFIYVYGTQTTSDDRHLLVARVAEGRLAEFSAWRFLTPAGWGEDPALGTRVVPEMGAEWSVSFLPAIQRYVLVYTRGGLSADILLRSAPRPEGPWSEPHLVYRCPETAWDDSYFCYAARAHPELANRPDELVISYVVNAFSFWKMAADARIYRPRFVRVRVR